MRMGAWLKLNGEAIYETEPWHRFGEGPTNGGDGLAHLMDDQLTANDVRFTRKGDDLYAIVCGWRSTPISVKSLGTNDLKGSKIKSVELIGHKGKVEWTQRPDGLSLTFPSHKFSEYAYVFKIKGDNLFPERKEYVEIDVPLTVGEDVYLPNIKEIRIVAKGEKKSVELAEIYTIGTVRKGVKEHNLARYGAPISSKCVYGMGAELAFDNNLNGNRNMSSIAKTTVGNNPYIGIKYDGKASISRVMLYPEMSSRAKVVAEYSLQVIDADGNMLIDKPLSEIAAAEGAVVTSYGVE